jgi:hypothetical protein
VADFLLAWHNAEENGGWDPVDLWQLDTGIAQDILLVTAFIAVEHKYPDDLGFAPSRSQTFGNCGEETGLSRPTHRSKPNNSDFLSQSLPCKRQQRWVGRHLAHWPAKLAQEGIPWLKN